MLGLGVGFYDLARSPYISSFSNKYSLSFDGSNDHIDVDTTLGPDINPATGTISAWVKLNTTSTTAQILSARRDSNNIIQLFYHAGSNEMRAIYKGDGTTKTANVDSGETIENSSNWHHIAMTWDTGEGNVKIYQDGELKETTAGIVEFSGDPPNKCDIGKSSGGDTAYFNGNIDELSVFTEVVNIETLYNSGVIKDLSGESGLVGYYRFEEGSGSSAIDSSGNNNTGTINGATYSTDLP
tara:strand:- start:120 stop:839 length:720 start_codon:yes stop_codon:yes gene_type:complete